MKLIKKIGITNLLFLSIFFLIWLLIFFTTNLFSIALWTSSKLILPFVALLVFVILLIYIIVKRKINLSKMLSLIICLLYISPFLLTMNIIKLAYPNTIKIENSLTIEFPLIESSIIGWGGDKYIDNVPHAMWASERWAYDIVINPYDINSTNLEDYGIWSKEVYSPVNGIIIAIENNEKDIIPGSEEFETLEGNYIYIKVENGFYLLLNHFKEESIDVKVGEQISVGDYLGRVGNSGSSSEPHLHIHYQRENPINTIHSTIAEGLPLYFNINDKSIMPTKGDEVILKKN